ncbi:MAG TPA: oligopeptide/dipeptide ABC transporter ATP-binding protein [Rhizomicrobium sp.]|nr:oligopeptide/dipeptide ABC transporter ATP-binding protein [Rhizomicrobium sp.]
MSTALLEVRDLSVVHHKNGHAFRAVDGVSLTLARGETLGLIGESGCGKSSLARAIMGLHRPAAGRILFDGADITARKWRRRGRAVARRLQMIFQDPQQSLNPRITVGRIVEEPLLVHGMRGRGQRRALVKSLLEKVGLAPDAGERLPHEFSGGQRQRIGIARALALTPDLVICDEPVSALDLSVQAQVLNLLADLQDEFKLSYLFISHDLSVVRHMAGRVVVMYLGRIVETGPAALLWDGGRHPYTRALIAAVPGGAVSTSRERRAALGDIPSPVDRPRGCAFHTRCPFKQSICMEVEPPLRGVGDSHAVACHFA